MKQCRRNDRVHMNKPRKLRLIGTAAALVVAALLVTGKLAGFGCATSAPSLSSSTQSSPAELMEGDWAGAWASSSSDMGGALRCRIDRLESGDYRARFDAVFAKVLTNQSIVTLRVGKRDEGKWWFSGEEDLGFLRGGIYKYTGHSDGSNFVCEYDSHYDKGTFRMTRAVTATTQPVPR